MGSPKAFKQGSYEIRQRFERGQSDSQKGSGWKGRAGRKLLQEAKQEMTLNGAVEMGKRR